MEQSCFRLELRFKIIVIVIFIIKYKVTGLELVLLKFSIEIVAVSVIIKVMVMVRVRVTLFHLSHVLGHIPRHVGSLTVSLLKIDSCVGFLGDSYTFQELEKMR
jgi:hypothetical protein